MKILVVSDTHGHLDLYEKLIQKIKPMDLVIHCGDIEGQELMFENLNREILGCNSVMVSGNNDFFSELDREASLEIRGHRILVTHGHTMYVSTNTDFIKQEAYARGYDIVVYGHTHRPVLDEGGAITALNPGSLSYPRQEGRLPSYAIITFERGYVYYSICYIDRTFFA